MDRRTLSVTDSQIERIFLMTCRCIQWPCTVVALGISAAFINKGPRILTDTYILIISAISVVFFMPAFATTFVTVPVLRETVIMVDLVFTQLWLTGFIFTAFQYNRMSCHTGVRAPCQTKFALEAFTFLTFIFTFFCCFLEASALLYARKKRYDALSATHSEKQSMHRGNDEMGGMGGMGGMHGEMGNPTVTSPHQVA